MKYTFPKYTETELLRNHLNLGGANHNGGRIDVTSRYLERNGKPWIGIMGEYHFSRDNRENWYTELCKMKAGGITVVATYMFWIYHEEIEGEFDFTGDRDIRFFVEMASKAGLDVLLRIGPWAHGECRNGGFPDWLLKKPFALRQTNEAFMAQVRIWYEKVYEQVQGLFYKDGGPIVGIQIENEFVDNAEYLLALKKLAQEIGFQVPIYTVTGWNSRFGAKIPVDDVIPVFGGYSEAPWAGHIKPLPLSIHYAFQSMRNDSAIGVDLIAESAEDGWRLPYERYPYVTCELGGGIQPTHHRRPIISGMDVYALSLCKLGSGNNFPGYYMYHGGTNKIGKCSTMNESKATGYPNDYSILSYDFQAVISEYGEIREQYRMLNILHMFINDFGDRLAPMELVEPEKKVAPEDLKSLRYVMRTDGVSGFVFLNHYQRLARLEDVEHVTIEALGYEFPEIDVRGDVSFFLPVHMDLSGNLLETATAQPMCHVDDTYYFVAIEGIEPVYTFAGVGGCAEADIADCRAVESICYRAKLGSEHALTVNNIKIVTLSWQEALYARKLAGKLYLGKDRDLYEENGRICAIEEMVVKAAFAEEILSEAPFEPKYIEELQVGGPRALTWKKITVVENNEDTAKGNDAVKSYGEAENAGVTDYDGARERFVEITDTYDVAQIYADGEMVADNFYYGRPWRVPVKLLWGKECYLVMSEMKDDFYREF